MGKFIFVALVTTIVMAAFAGALRAALDGSPTMTIVVLLFFAFSVTLALYLDRHPRAGA